MAPDSQLDYHFGWRWLIPTSPGDHVLMLGFSEHELAFWKQALPNVEVTKDAAKATVWLVNELPPDCAKNLDSAHLRSLCVVGSGQATAVWRGWMDGNFTEIVDYALLPASNPRLVVPLDNSDWIVQGLTLHRPGRLIGQLTVALLKVGARLGITRPLRKRVVCIANRDSGTLPQGSRQSGLELSNTDAPPSFALYLGAPDDNRKTVVLPLGGVQSTILKQGESPKAKASLKNESESLQALSRTPLSPHVPMLLNFVESTNTVALHQEYRPRKYIRHSKFRKETIKFLADLSWQNRAFHELSNVSNQLWLTSENYELASLTILKKKLNAIAESGHSITGNRSHGDFAPWNCSWTAKGFFVFDWEDSQPWDVAFFDAFYFIVSRALYVDHSLSSTLVEKEALSLARELAKKAALNVKDLHLYWALWLLRQETQNPSPLIDKLIEQLVVTWK